MHAFSKNQWTINHNGDYNGDAYVTDPAGNTFAVPCRFLLDFAADYVRVQRIAQLEGMSDENILKCLSGIKL